MGKAKYYFKRLIGWDGVLLWIIAAILFSWLAMSASASEYQLPVDEPIKINGNVWLSSWYWHKRADYGGSAYRALNIPVRRGSVIRSCADGIVVDTGYKYRAGMIITILQTDGIKMSYQHLSDWNVVRGQKIKKGDVIGFAGSTGATTGSHLRLVAYNKEGEQVFISDKFGAKFYLHADGNLDKNWL